jgi:hypothetical protein
MASTRSHALRRRTWIALFINGVLMSLGCNPATMAMFLAPFVDNKNPPEYSLAEAKKEATVAVMVSFAPTHLEDRREVLPADYELAEKVTQHIKMRSQLNKEKIKLVPVAQVRSYQTKLGARSGVTPAELGKNFSADFVIFLEIDNLSLYEKKSFGDLYRGNTEIAVSLYDLAKPEGEQKVFDKPYRCEYPGSGPRDAGSYSVAQFRGMFLTKIAREVSKMFVAYPADERTEME